MILRDTTRPGSAIKQPLEPSGLEFIRPRIVELKIDGVAVSISPLVLRDLPNVLAQAMPIFASLRQEGGHFFQRLASNELTEKEISGLLVSLTAAGENWIALLALLCRQPADWIGGLLIDRAAKLMFTALEVNADFFRMAMPVLARLAADATAAARATSSATPTDSSS